MANEEIVMPEDSGEAGEVPFSQTDLEAQDLPNEEADAASDDDAKAASAVQAVDAKLEKRLTDTQAALKESQKEYHAMREAIAKMEGQMSGMQASQQREEVRDYLDDEALKDKLDKDPAAAMVEVIKMERANFAELLRQRDSYHEKMRQQMIREATNPEVAELRGAMSELSKNDWFSALDAKGQIAAAKSWSDANPVKAQTRTPPSKGPGGTGRRAAVVQQEDARQKEADAKAAAIFGTMSGGEEDLYPVPEARPKGGK